MHLKLPVSSQLGIFCWRSTNGYKTTIRSLTNKRCRVAVSQYYQPIGNMSTYGLKFDNQALKALPIDKEEGSRIRKVEGACFSLVKPTPVENPQLLAVSEDALALLSIDPSAQHDSDFAAYFSGNKLLDGSQTAAHCYCGHQFGYFSGQLGDGCAIYLGEVVNASAERWEIQLKGAGKTPYSRQADGRKVLRSSVREFLCSEAMHYLGVPTTRAGTCVTSDTKVVRDIHYDGNPKQERATVVLRIAPSFIRFGSFEIVKPIDLQTMMEGPSVRRKDVLDELINYTIKSFFPNIWKEDGDREEMMVKFYEEVLRRTARLVAKWQCIGWCHGVLNTDNMSILGLTIDYGPFGFMDRFDPDFICNGSDDGGRYSYANQPQICRWNCEKLAEALKMSLPLHKSKASLTVFDEEYDQAYKAGMRAKFGLLVEDDSDMDLIASFLSTLFETGCDFTNAFRNLSLLQRENSGFQQTKDKLIKALMAECASVDELIKSCAPRIPPGQLAMFMSLIQQQPELAQALGRQFKMVEKELKKQERRSELQKLNNEEKESLDREKWMKWVDRYTDRLEREYQTSTNMETHNKTRSDIMNRSNPKFVLRNYIAQEVIEMAEAGDFSGVRNLLQLLKDPYCIEVSSANLATDLCSLGDRYKSRPPPSALGLVVT